MSLVTCISDLHGLYKQVKIKTSDIIICCGDLHYISTEPMFIDFCKWFQNQAPHKILVAGNHDWFLQSEKGRKYIKNILKFYNIIYLEDSAVTIEGTKIYGTPYQPVFGYWAFNLPETQLKLKWKAIEKDTNILVTHCPAYGIGDINSYEEHCGSKSLYNTIKNKELIHVFGHIHESYGEYFNEDLYSVNCSLCDGNYNLVNKPITFTI